MRPEARYAAAISVLDCWLDGMPAEQALTRWARGARYAGSKDRAAVRDHVYDVLRRRDTCALAGGGSDGRAMVIGLLRLTGTDPGSVFTGEGHAPSALSEAEVSTVPDVPPSTTDLPAWMLAELDEGRIADIPAFLEAQARRAPVWLRVNGRKASPSQAIAALASDGVTINQHRDVAGALCVTEGARRVRQSGAFADGWVEVQDLSPQWAVARLSLPDRGRILDYCAGGGGKALALADRSDAAIFAHDALLQRMADLPPRAKRAGVQIAQVTTDALQDHAPFDLVLADVPCSGSGTWRRDPEGKWRLTQARLTELVDLQAHILDQAASLVAPGGQLVYMTCSVFRAENDAQIDAFLDRNPGWRCTNRHLDTPLTASDGFFSATLTRATDSPEA